jgi:hypothetical protein
MLGFRCHAWAYYSVHRLLQLNFECTTGLSLIDLYTGRQMGLNFIYEPYMPISTCEFTGQQYPWLSGQLLVGSRLTHESVRSPCTSESAAFILQVLLRPLEAHVFPEDENRRLHLDASGGLKRPPSILPAIRPAHRLTTNRLSR